jgi:hypothetical protein
LSNIADCARAACHMPEEEPIRRNRTLTLFLDPYHWDGSALLFTIVIK